MCCCFIRCRVRMHAISQEISVAPTPRSLHFYVLLLPQVKIYFALMHLHPLDVRITYRGTPGSDVQDAEELTLSTMAQLNDARYGGELVFVCAGWSS